MNNLITILKDLPSFYNEQGELFAESQKLREELSAAIKKRDQLASLLADANQLVYVTRVASNKVDQKILDNKNEFFYGDNSKR